MLPRECLVLFVSGLLCACSMAPAAIPASQLEELAWRRVRGCAQQGYVHLYTYNTMGGNATIDEVNRLNSWAEQLENIPAYTRLSDRGRRVGATRTRRTRTYSYTEGETELELSYSHTTGTVSDGRYLVPYAEAELRFCSALPARVTILDQDVDADGEHASVLARVEFAESVMLSSLESSGAVPVGQIRVYGSGRPPRTPPAREISLRLRHRDSGGWTVE